MAQRAVRFQRADRPSCARCWGSVFSARSMLSLGGLIMQHYWTRRAALVSRARRERGSEEGLLQTLLHLGGSCDGFACDSGAERGRVLGQA